MQIIKTLPVIVEIDDKHHECCSVKCRFLTESLSDCKLYGEIQASEAMLRDGIYGFDRHADCLAKFATRIKGSVY